MVPSAGSCGWVSSPSLAALNTTKHGTLTSPLPYVSTVTHMILMSVRIRLEVSGDERWWEEFLVEIPVRPLLSHFLTLAYVQKLTMSGIYHQLGATT